VGKDRRSEGMVGVQDRERAAARVGQRRTARQTAGTGGSSRGGGHDSIGSHEHPDLQGTRDVSRSKTDSAPPRGPRSTDAEVDAEAEAETDAEARIEADAEADAETDDCDARFAPL
jgi:hypothetical protein